MGFDVSLTTGYQLENREVLKQVASNIINRAGNNTSSQQAIFNQSQQLKELYTNAQLNVLKASTQITLNGSLKETIKYLNKHAISKKHKPVVFGELWAIATANNSSSDNKNSGNELYEFQIDKNAKNIFAA